MSARDTSEQFERICKDSKCLQGLALVTSLSLTAFAILFAFLKEELVPKVLTSGKDEPRHNMMPAKNHVAHAYGQEVATHLGQHATSIPLQTVGVPCQLPLASRIPGPWCHARLTPCHFRSCAKCKQECLQNAKCRKHLYAFRIVSASVSADLSLQVVVSGPMRKMRSSNITCSDELVLVVKGPMLTQTYMKEPRGVLQANTCVYELSSLPLLPGEYRFVVEARVLGGAAFSAQPSALNASNCHMPVALESRGDKRTRKVQEQVAKELRRLFVEAYGPHFYILDQPIEPGIVAFSTQIASVAVPVANCEVWSSHGVWIHWSSLDLLRELCGPTLPCNDIESRDDFVWCARAFANHTSVSQRYSKVQHKIRIMMIGSSLMGEIWRSITYSCPPPCLVSCYGIVDKTYKHLSVEAINRRAEKNQCNLSNYTSVTSMLDMGVLSVFGVHTRAYKSATCESLLHQIKGDVVAWAPDVIWIEETIHSYQKMDDQPWLSLLDSYMGSIRSVFKGPLVVRGLTPYALLQCSPFVPEFSKLFYLISSLSRVGKLNAGLKSIAARHGAHVVDLFELVANRPELMKDSPHMNPLNQCNQIQYERVFGNKTADSGKPCPKRACDNYWNGCHMDSAMAPRTLMSYQLASFFHHSTS